MINKGEWAIGIGENDAMANDTPEETATESPRDSQNPEVNGEALEELVEGDPSMMIENMADMTKEVVEGRRLFVVALKSTDADYLGKFMRAEGETCTRVLERCIAGWKHNHQYRENDQKGPVRGYAGMAG